MEENRYTFIVDSEKLDGLSLFMYNSSKELQEIINEIYIKINELSTVWSGEVYQEFVRTCSNYRTSLETNVLLLKSFANEFQSMSSDAEFLDKSISSYMNRIKDDLFVLNYDRGEIDE